MAQELLTKLNQDFLIPYLAFYQCFMWISLVKMENERDEYFYYFHSPYFDETKSSILDGIKFLLTLCIAIALAIIWIKVGFVIFAYYLGITIISTFISLLIIGPFLIGLFGYGNPITSFLLPHLCAIGTAIWMFTKVGTFN